MPSTTIAAVLLVVGLLVGAGITYAIAPSFISPSTSTFTTTVASGGATITNTVTNTVTTGGGGSALLTCGCTITLGDLIDLTGSQAAWGVQQKVAIDKAVADVNAWLKSIGDTVQFTIVHEDTQTDPAVTLQKLQTLNSLGVKVTIGAQISSEAANALPYAQANNIVMLSPEATSPLFDTSTHPYLFLVAPTDDQAAAGQSALAIHQGAQAAIIINRHDTWGDPYGAFVNSSFLADGGKAATILSYTPVTSGTYDFSAQLTAAQSQYQKYASQYGANHVVLINAGFDEVATLFSQAATSYPSLLNMTWFTTDETSDFLTTAGSAAVGHQIYSTQSVPGSSSKTADFLAYMGTQTGIGAPEQFAQTAYDAVWLAALTILSVGKYDGAAVNAALPSVAANYFGVSGWTLLNKYGDRVGTDFAIYQVTGTSASNLVWTQIGSYSSTGKLTLTTG